MEDFEYNKNNKRKPQQGMTDNQKGWLVFAGLAVIAFFGGFYLLFLSSDQEQLASELAMEVREFEGAGYQKKISAFMQNELNVFAPEGDENTKELVDTINSLNYNATFSPLVEFFDDEFGGVKIDEVVVTNKISQDSYTDLIIKKKPSEPNKYYFIYEGETKQFMDDPSLSATPRASFITKFFGASGLLQLDDSKQLRAIENSLDKVSFNDGSGSITYLTLEDVKAKISKNLTMDRSDFAVKISAAKVDLGEALKFMLGDIKPMSVNFDMEYSGDSISKLERISQTKVDDFAKFLQEGAAEKAAEISAAEKYSGHIKLKDFALMSGEMGFTSNADLQFNGFPYVPVPVGELNFSIKNYNQIISYLRSFFPLPEEEVARMLNDSADYFTNDGTDLSFKAIFDGTKIVKLGNGKTLDLLKKPENPWITGDNSAQKIEDNPFETPVKSESKPVATPKVEQKELDKL
jgi:predicted HicB family RNase H-like nuclease